LNFSDGVLREGEPIAPVILTGKGQQVTVIPTQKQTFISFSRRGGAKKRDCDKKESPEGSSVMQP